MYMFILKNNIKNLAYALYCKCISNTYGITTYLIMFSVSTQMQGTNLHMLMNWRVETVMLIIQYFREHDSEELVHSL